MKKILGTTFVFLIFAFCQSQEESCQKADTYNHLNGSCIKLGEEECAGIAFRRGCIGKDCALCIENTTICIEKPPCEKANGECIRNFTDCDRLINERHCHGDCACCKNGCTRQPKCKDAGGYCMNKDRKQFCNGTQFNLGCLGYDCFCCVPDTSICIDKLGCSNAKGFSLKKANWTDCDNEIDSSFSLGDDCACCREKKCVREPACKDQGGYCFRQKKIETRQHICNGTELATGCGSDTCRCCIPDSE